MKGKFSTAAVVLVTLSCLSGCDLLNDDTEEVQKNVAPITPHFLTPIFWLDDERVLFTGIIDAEIDSDGHSFRLQRGIFIWNVATETSEQYAESIGGLCYSDGFITYVVERISVNPTVVKVALGEIGKEELKTRNQEEELDRLGKQQWISDGFSCQTRGRPPDTVGLVVRALRSQDGYLDFGLPDRTLGGSERSGVLVTPDGSRVKTEFPLAASISHFDYYAFADAYFGTIQAHREISKWKKTDCLPGWWLWPNGRTKKTCVTYGRWGENPANLEVLPTKVGTIVKSTQLTGGDSTSDSGLYLVNGHVERKLVDGVVGNESVSPNGCRIVFTHIEKKALRNPTHPKSVTLISIDICDLGD